jgi:hypothetical protein
MATREVERREDRICIDMQASAATSVGLRHRMGRAHWRDRQAERSQPHPDRQVHRAWLGDLLASG